MKKTYVVPSIDVEQFLIEAVMYEVSGDIDPGVINSDPGDDAVEDGEDEEMNIWK